MDAGDVHQAAAGGFGQIGDVSGSHHVDVVDIGIIGGLDVHDPAQ